MGTHGHVYLSPQPKSFEELAKWLQQSTFSLSTVWDILNSHQVAMDNLHAVQMELNHTIEETHCLQSSQSVFLQVLEHEFEHFVTEHWCLMQAIVHHSRVHLLCTCPLHLAAQCPFPSPTSSGYPLPQQRPASESGSGPNGFVTAPGDEPGCSSSVPPLISCSSSVSNSPSSLPTLFQGRLVSSPDFCTHLTTRTFASSPCQGHSTLTLPVHYSAPSQGQLVQLEVLTQ